MSKLQKTITRLFDIDFLRERSFFVKHFLFFFYAPPENPFDKTLYIV